MRKSVELHQVKNMLEKLVQLKKDANVDSVSDVIDEAKEEQAEESDNKTKGGHNKVFPPPITTDM